MNYKLLSFENLEDILWKIEHVTFDQDFKVHSMLQHPLIRSLFDFSVDSQNVAEDSGASEDEIIDEEEDRRKRKNFRLSRTSRSGKFPTN